MIHAAPIAAALVFGKPRASGDDPTDSTSRSAATR